YVTLICLLLHLWPFIFTANPKEPSLVHPETATEGHPYTVTCSVIHTCPSHMPKLTWSRSGTDKPTESHRQLHHGYWEIQSILTIIPEEKDDHSVVTCTAEFNGGKTSAASMKLYIKRGVNYKLIIIPTAVGIGLAVIFSIFCIVMVKKYKRRIAELQSQDGSMWNRLSRLSRRRSIWSRFSRRPRGDMVDHGHTANNVNSQSCTNQKFSKPRFPSPKSQPKSSNYKEDFDDGDDYMNTADLNVNGKMSGFNHIFLSFCIIGFILSCSSAWYVKLPSSIKGLQGSCLVIPCSFDYYQYPPKRPDRVVWYQYVDRGYPLVYDNWHRDSVIDQFRRKTSLFNPMTKSCSLMIYPVTWYHHRQKIYPWIDPENVGYRTYRFYDTTVTIDVVDTAEKPEIMISGDRTVGQNVQVECSVSHTCPTYPPILKLNIPVKHPQIHTTMFMYRYKTSLTTMLHIEKDHQTVQCDVIHTGGLRATNSMTLNAACSISPLTISQSSQEFLEGYASTVTCTATYTCPADTPTLRWNYENMPASTATEKVSNTQWKAVSTLRFTASGNDHGKSLTCYAQFTGGGRQEKSIILSVKRNMLSRDWSFTTPSSITGMRGSCIIIPCRFTYKNSQPPNLRVI
ncbi:hypothetical protein INR49_024231, partial [Caranx melampygus]